MVPGGWGSRVPCRPGLFRMGLPSLGSPGSELMGLGAVPAVSWSLTMEVTGFSLALSLPPFGLILANSVENKITLNVMSGFCAEFRAVRWPRDKEAGLLGLVLWGRMQVSSAHGVPEGE